ncbi:MAG TPA: serine--tRNA ligase [bacterium]|nr:serine--tRNA ligase [bacterium]
MLDIKDIRKNPEKYKNGLAKKNVVGQVEKLLELDKQRREKITRADQLKAVRNKVSKEIGELKREGQSAEDKIQEMRKVADEIKELDNEVADLETERDQLLISLPNIPHKAVPAGETEEDNQFVKDWGEKSRFDFDIKDHLDLGEDLDILDFQRAAKFSGTGFPLYKKEGAALERALINYMLQFHTNKHGYDEIFPPFLVNRDAATGTGQLPKLEEDMYNTTDDDLFLIPTAEVPVTNIHREEIIPEKELPIKYTAYSACFRREAGSYGKETRGLSRLHQFNKVEMVQFVKPEDSYQVHEKLLQDAEDILQALGLHYRVVNLCCGDLSFAAAKCYDIEVWAPGSEKFYEVSSISNFEDFQARRASIRYRRKSDNQVDFLHTLNGSGLATPRLMIALMEQYQTRDGNIIIPKALHPFTGFTKISKY